MKKINKKALWLTPVLLLAAQGVLAAGTVMATINKQNILGNGESGLSSSNDGRGSTSLSSNGASLAFHSSSYNFVAGDGNRSSDVFIRAGSKLISRISVSSEGKEARNSAANWYDSNRYADSLISKQAITPDGKFVVFHSAANNLDLLTQDTNNDTANSKHWDVFLRDVAKKKTYRLSGIMAGATDPSLKNDDPWVITTQGNDASTHAAIAGTAKQAWVVFETKATNLSDESFNLTANKRRIYLLDLKTKKLELISAVHDADGVATDEARDADASNAVVDCYNPTISPDGRFVAFQSEATNLFDVGTGNGNRDIFIYDRLNHDMYQLSGTAGTVSGSGGFTINTEGTDDSSNPYLAGGGKDKTYLIAYDSKATIPDLLPEGGVQVSDSGNDSDVYLIKFAPMDSADPDSLFEIKEEKRISVLFDDFFTPIAEGSLEGDPVDPSSQYPAVSGTSTAYAVAYRSSADNLLYDPDDFFWNLDTNRVSDVFVYDSKTGLNIRANVDSGGEESVEGVEATAPSISPEGRIVGFSSEDAYLVPFFGDNGNNNQIFLRTR